MAYSDKAKELRKCRAIKPNGERCEACALWGHPKQLCVAHACRHHRGSQRNARGHLNHAPVVACKCGAYPFPHRPGGRDCNWPDRPEERREERAVVFVEHEDSNRNRDDPEPTQSPTPEGAEDLPGKRWIGGPRWRSAQDLSREKRERQDVLEEIRERQGDSEEDYDPLKRK